MLYVETNNPQEQLTLQQQFSREGNLFGVPIKKTCQITRILSALLFEIFHQPNSPTELKSKPTHPLSKLVDKLSHFFENILNLTFSLSQIRQILEIIKIQSTKITLYEDYIEQLNRKLIPDAEEQQEQSFLGPCLAQFTHQENQFQEEAARSNLNNQILDIDFINFQGRMESNTKQFGCTISKPRNSFASIQFKYDSPADEDAQTMHTLKSQITSSPKFSLTPLAQIQLDKKRATNSKMDRLQNSLHYSQDERKSEDHDLIDVKDEFRMQTQNSTNSIFYCPEWKKNEDDQKKGVKALMPSQSKKVSSNDSNYIQNLSGRVHPVPSFLHDDSLGEMIVRQKKEDVRKSIILKKSMHGIEQKKIASNQYAYSSNLRLIKYHNKLRRNSKKSLCSKKDIDELKEAQQARQQSKLAKEKNINFASDDRLLKPKEKIEQIRTQNSKTSRKMEDLIQSKLKAERKSSEMKNKTGKVSTFFKSTRQ